MSVLIKGFEMPKDGCKDCVMVERGFVSDICPFLKREVNGNVKRGGKPNGCPLIEVPDTNVGDTISRQAAIDEMEKAKERYFDRRVIIGKMQDIVNNLPSAQPEQRWVPVTERLPENDNEVLITVWDAEDDYVEVYKGFYQGHEWWTQWCHGCSKIKDEPCGENIVIAWMPFPEPWKGEADG